MHVRARRRNPILNRRAWLAGALASGLAAAVRGAEPKPAAGEEREVAEVAQRAKAAGLPPFRVGRTAHYLGLGDASDRFRGKALPICEGLARDYLEHFQRKGFAVERPGRRLTVILLADAESFAKFVGEEPGRAVGGQYDLETNRLVIFDNRPAGRAGVERAERANLVALVHEAAHQLTFNTGLLRRAGDVPLSISEGLAMDAEVRKPTGRSLPGQPNPGRVEALALARTQGVEWVPLAKLLVGDPLLEGDSGADVQQAAYGQSWLLVHDLMQTPARLPGFRDYLAAIAPRTDGAHRLDDARAHLGDLAKLDADLRRHAGRLIEGKATR